MKELSIGTHLSVAKGYAALAKDAVQIGANTFQLFIRNPQGKGVKTGGDRDIPGHFAKARFWAVYSPCSVYSESLFVKPASEGTFRPDDGGGSAADGADAGKPVQSSSGQPSGPASGQRH